MIRWLKRIAIGVVGLVALCVLAGTAFEAASRAYAKGAYPPAGRLVDIGGRRMQIDCRGAGTPVVVFESGLDTLGALSWSTVQDAVARTTRACAYSRAGVMWSDPSNRPFSPQGEAEDLHRTLAAAGETPPFVMVGHSLGGPYLLNYTGQYPAEVAGLVFVDASHPDQVARMNAAIGKPLDQGADMAKIGDRLSWTGIVRIMNARGPGGPPGLSRQAARANAALLPRSLHAMVGEFDGIGATFADAGRHRNLGDRPLVVLTHGEPTPPAALAAAKINAEQGRRLDAEWLKLQDEEATWSTHSRHTIVEGAPHYIHLVKPQVVVDAIKDVVGQVRAH